MTFWPSEKSGGSTSREACIEAGLKKLLGDSPLVAYVPDPTRISELSVAASRGIKLWTLVLWAALFIALFEPWLANRISFRQYGKPASAETRRQGDKETRRQGDKETGRQGDQSGSQSSVSLSPGLLVSLSGFADLHFAGVQHSWLWLVLLPAGAVLLFFTYHGIFQRSERRLTWVLLLLRGAGVLALVICLANPTWTRTHVSVDAGRVAVILDTSQSMTLPDASGQPRYTLAKKAAAELERVLGAPAHGARLEADLFDINGMPLGGKVPAEPRAGRTDLGKALIETGARMRSKPLAAIVLISDGMDNTGRQGYGELADLPAPVFTVGFRPEPAAAGFDLALKKVTAPQRAMVHNDVKVQVLVGKTGGGAMPVKVHIKRGRDVLATQSAAFGANDAEQLINVNFKPSQVGSFVFTATVEAEGGGERNLSNNSQHFPLRVDAEPIRILYLEGFLRYEYKYLKKHLENDPDVSLVAVVRRINPDLKEEETGKDLVTAERLKNIDVVILGDMEGNYINEAEYKAILRWLDEKGHALLVLGGYNSFGPEGLRRTPLAEALPVVFAEQEPTQSEESFRLELTEEGRRHPIFEVSGDRVKDEAAWSEAPPLLGSSLVQRVKPGAVVLAVNPKANVGGQPAVAAAAQRYGAGQVMVLTVDTTWRWSRMPRIIGQADTLYARFWSQAVRWLAGRSTDEQRPLLLASTDRPDYDVAKPVSIKVVRQPRAGIDLAGSVVAVEVTGPDGKTIGIPVQANSARPDEFAGTLYPETGGRYELTAHLSSGGKLLANQVAEFMVHGADIELADPGTNRQSLEAIASVTQGHYFDIDEAGKLSDQIMDDKLLRKERRVSHLLRTELWDSPLLFLFFLAAVTAEWVIRRRNHLV